MPSFEKTLLDIMEQHYGDESLKASTLHHYLKMSRSTVHNKVTACFQQSPAIFIRDFRVKKAAKLLLQERMPVKLVAYQVGFRDPNYFSRVFRDQVGTSPSDFRRNQGNLNNTPED